LWLAGCGPRNPPLAETDSDVAETDSDVAETDSDVVDTDTGVVADLEVLRLPPPTSRTGGHIGVYAVSGGVCANCHSNAEGALALRDDAGRGVAPVDLFRGSVMAHAARDPFFRATLAATLASTPTRAPAIAQECLACHAPAAWAEATLAGTDPPGVSVLSDPGPAGELARDGAGCIGCHLQDPERQGDERFSGHHALVADRRLFGPHRGPEVGPMRSFTTFTPTYSDHLLDGALCGGCHTLETPAVRADGSATGHTLTEQAPYLEWRSSAYYPPRGQAEARTCQGCHVPITDAEGGALRTAIARNPSGQDFPRLFDREPVGRHQLVGGNTLLLETVRDYRELLGSPATEAEIQASIDATRALLGTAASLEVLPAILLEDRVEIPVRVHNRTGHKLPTGYPARRAWLHVRVIGPDGAVLLESGATNVHGHIVDAGGEALVWESGGPPPAHRGSIRSAEDVLVWQAWMEDEAGVPTTELLRGVRYLKDNRVLPAGFAPSGADAAKVMSVGVGGDADFVAGSDSVVVVLDAPPPTVTLEVAVRYQAFAPAFLRALVEQPVPEAAALGLMVGGRGIPVETLASIRHEVRTIP
jgi:hypothetical protein